MLMEVDETYLKGEISMQALVRASNSKRGIKLLNEQLQRLGQPRVDMGSSKPKAIIHDLTK